MGLARRNLENHERDKTVKIMQRFSFDFEEAKVMIANLVAGVKNLDADHNFDDAAMKKRFSLERCCKNQFRHSHAAWEAFFCDPHPAWEHDFCIL